MQTELKKYLTLGDIESVIISEEYNTKDTLTICTLTLKNGAKVVGLNYGAIDPGRQDFERGKDIARKAAIEKVWELEGYLLRQRLIDSENILKRLEDYLATLTNQRAVEVLPVTLTATIAEKPHPSIVPIDWKYQIKAINPCSLNTHDQYDSILFLAKDAAVPAMLKTYRDETIRLGSNPAHIEAVELLLSRVIQYQAEVESKVPDTDLPCEIRRCVDGENVNGQSSV